MHTWIRKLPLFVVLSTISFAATAQQSANFDEELRRIFERNEYRAETFGPATWLEEGRRYTTVEPSAAIKEAQDLVAYDTASGRREVLVSASDLKPA